MKSSQAGFSLVEILVASALGAIALLVATNVFLDILRRDQTIGKVADGETERRLARQAIEGVVQRAMRLDLWLNPETVEALGAPWALDGIDSGTGANAFVRHGALISGTSTPATDDDIVVADPSGQSQVVFFITSTQRVPQSTSQAPAGQSDVEYSAVTTDAVLNVSTPCYLRAPAVLGIGTRDGVQFVQSTAVDQSTGTVNFSTLGSFKFPDGSVSSLAARFIPSGAPVFEVQGVLIGKAAENGRLVVVRTVFAKGFVVSHQGSHEIDAFEVTSFDGTALGAPAGTTSGFRLGTGSRLLRARAQRTMLTGGSTVTDASLEVRF